ncbi:glycosyltransferase 87 family protein [Amycolatopsis acidicola]|uniref:glycosyltransferase 87 family protein n=1 Tax=Amycolatopsis acidicola TaxID=2596893 RepID=UPI001FB7087E|nr:glycosyltransferase 87 family protein [Amycolatopsis acidicola]
MPRRKIFLTLLAGELVLLAVVALWKRLDGLDLDVYRLGAQAFFGHGDPYGVLPPTRDGTVLPFTYPPFAAIAFAPLLSVSLDTALWALTVISVLALGAVLALCFSYYDRRAHVAGVAVLAVQAVALFSEPVRATLGFGQINILLMLLVVVDTLGPVKQRGYLIGVAAAVKLTPLAFVLFFLVRKDFRSAARALGTFVVCGVIAWFFAPDASVKYWTRLVFQGERIGDPGYIGNQSLRGLLARLDLGRGWWALAAVLVLALTAWAIHRAKYPVPALLACALGALLVSPVSWTHHWVWIGPVIGVLCWQRRWWAAVPATIVFVVSPLWDYSFWPLRECYVLAGLVLLALLGKPFHHVLDAVGQRGDVARIDGGEHADA